MSWIYLMMAILLEVVGTTCMKLSVGFTKLVPSVAMFLLYGASLGVLTLALKKIDLNIAYATWSGLGTMLIVLLGIVIYDEPTTGLHYDDVRKLIDVLQRLVSHGNTVMVIEHNLDVIKTADWIVDLGPDGGARGGHLMGEGTPEQIAAIEGSETGQYLKPTLNFNNNLVIMPVSA